MAQIRATQEEILRPKNKKAYSSTRSNHSYSDFDASHDEGRLTPNQRQVSHAAIGVGKSASFVSGKEAAVEYFGKPSDSMSKRVKARAKG